MTLSATYSPEDNKLRLYSTSRLGSDTYARVKAAGFKWAPKQELFVAPAWTPGREDLLIELCGEIGDEDTSLVDRAEERAERFEDYSDKRRHDAEQAREAVAAIADHIPLGQPILVGHHSERHARKDAERIENGMRRAVKMWETSQYWTDRAQGAIAHAKHKERPDVRARRIKGLEADKRKQEKTKDKAATCLKLWTKDGLTIEKARFLAGQTECGHLTVCHPSDGGAFRRSYGWSAYDVLRPDDERYADCPGWTVEQVQEVARRVYPSIMARCDRWIAHLDNRLAYERAMLAEDGGLAADGHDIQPGGQVLVGGEWLTVVRVNKSQGQAVSVTTNARYCRVKGIETVKNYRPPTEEQSATVKAATKLPPMCNYPGEGFVSITQAEWDGRHKDCRGSRVIKATTACGLHRVRSGMFGPRGGYGSVCVYITDAKRKDPPAPEAAPIPALPPVELDLPTLERQAARRAAFQAEAAPTEFDAMRDTLKAGIQVVSAPQLFPTPPDLAARVVDMADIQPGQRILEPSAGTGALLDKLVGSQTEVFAVEINGDLVVRLCKHTLAVVGRGGVKDYAIKCADFLSCNGDLGTFDRIVMNPPFADGADIKHIRHALAMLKPGGRLVAICANGPRQREQLMPEAIEWHDLPPGSFAEQGTNVNAAIAVFDR